MFFWLFHSSVDVPQLIEDLQGKTVVRVAAGSLYSAAVTNTGQLYTWGRGRYYRLGHGRACFDAQNNCLGIQSKFVI